MKMADLVRHGFPQQIIDLWRAREGESLLPLQALAVREYGLFGGGNLLFRAPTSSGKTFIGEMAAVHAALARRKVVYLVPLKALAEEKYRSFRAKYARYGLNVIVSSRDHRVFDGAFEAGAFSIAVVVYEKMGQLLVRRPERLEEIGLAVADELELLSDPERGAQAEWLLTHVLRRRRRLIGLSAVLGQAGRLAAWMDADLVEHDQRPVELRCGVAGNGVFRYRTSNNPGESEEPAAECEAETEWAIVSANVRLCAERGESCLVFVKSRLESRRGAEELASMLRGSAAEDAIEALRGLESTHSRDNLLQTLNSGVAFHNADLTPQERAAVETGFRNGEIRVLVATSTLAQGLNLPARNVFIPAEKWRYDRRFGTPWKAPITRAEYESMSGRAGRYGAGHDFGRAILAAPTDFDEETLWRRYIEGSREGVEPQLGRSALHDHVVRLAAAETCVTRAGFTDFFHRTLSAEWTWRESLTPGEAQRGIDQAIQRAVDGGMIEETGGAFAPTPLGQAAAAKGVGVETAEELLDWLRVADAPGANLLDAFIAVLATPCGKLFPTPLSAREYENAGYAARLKQQTAGMPLDGGTPLNRMRRMTTLGYDDMRIVKGGLLLQRWIAQDALYRIEETFHVLSGQITALADHAAWLIDAAAALAEAAGLPDGVAASLRHLGEQTQYGVCEDALPLMRLALPSLDRAAVLALSREGLDTPAALAQCDPQRLRVHLNGNAAEALRQWACEQIGAEETPSSAPAPVLQINDDRPNEILVDGESIPLQDKQYRFIKTLALTPGACVDYETLYQALWGEVIVEPGQIHFQKGRLLKRIASKCPSRKRLVRTVPKRGVILDLPPGEVSVNGDTPSGKAPATKAK